MTTQTRPAPRRRTATAATAFAAALALLAGCSGGDGSDGDGTDGRTSDGAAPLTVVGACSQLVGPAATLVDDALGAGDAVTESNGAAADVTAAAAVQEKLFAIVSAGPDQLQDPVGLMVDYLDDPAAFEDPEGISDKVTGAVTSIDTICTP